jgi:hypothetical protein
MADPLVDVAVRVYADFADRATLAEVLAVVGRCRTDLDTPSRRGATRNGRAIGPAAAHRSPHPACHRQRIPGMGHLTTPGHLDDVVSLVAEVADEATG